MFQTTNQRLLQPTEIDVVNPSKPPVEPGVVTGKSAIMWIYKSIMWIYKSSSETIRQKSARLGRLELVYKTHYITVDLSTTNIFLLINQRWQLWGPTWQCHIAICLAWGLWFVISERIHGTLNSLLKLSLNCSSICLNQQYWPEIGETTLPSGHQTWKLELRINRSWWEKPCVNGGFWHTYDSTCVFPIFDSEFCWHFKVHCKF